MNTSAKPFTPTAAPHYSIDVECVATGKDHNARAVAQVSLIDERENVLLNVYVKPDTPVVSYLTALTGLTKEIIDQHGIPLADAVGMLRACLPRTAVLVGQNIRSDIQWLSLQEGRDFAGLVDLMGLYRIWNEQYKSFSQFSQDHLAKTLLAWDTTQPHNAVGDAMKSMRLFQLHKALQAEEAQWDSAKAALLATPPEPSFARRYPEYEGCCMGNRKTCTCGGVFFF